MGKYFPTILNEHPSRVNPPDITFLDFDLTSLIH